MKVYILDAESNGQHFISAYQKEEHAIEALNTRLGMLKDKGITFTENAYMNYQDEDGDICEVYDLEVL